MWTNSLFTSLKLTLAVLLGFSLISTQATANSENTAKINIRDSHGKWSFEKTPERIAVINWTLTEQLLELDFKPIAIADVTGFEKAAPDTLVPEGITDIGSRFAPDLSKLKETKPDLIIIGYSQRDLLRPLSNIAPVMYFKSFGHRYDNAAKADQRFRQLAKLTSKTDLAESKLEARDAKINSLKNKLNKHFKNSQPTFTAVNIDKSNWAFVNNSLAYSVIEKLGLTPAFNEKPGKLGVKKVNAKELSSSDCLLFVAESKKIDTACSYQLEPVHLYGGSMAQGYIAEKVTNAIIGN